MTFLAIDCIASVIRFNLRNGGAEFPVCLPILPASQQKKYFFKVRMGADGCGLQHKCHA